MAVTTEARGAVRVVRIDRPEARNALDPETSAGLVDAFDAAATDDHVRAVVLTAVGDRAFCAGMDLKAFSADGPVASPLTAFLRQPYPKPLIAAVNGPAVAGGFELVLACDLVVAVAEAWFALPEVQRGLFPAGGGTLLPRRIPLAVALELGLTGSRIDADRAAALGLVNRVVARDRLLDEALSLAGEIAGNGPLAVRATKELMLATAHGDASSLWAQVDRAKAHVFASDDAREGAAAFVARRQPQWTGR